MLLWPLDLEPRDRSMINITDLIFENLVSVFGLKILKFFYADPNTGSCHPWIRDGKNRIRDPGSEKNNIIFQLLAYHGNWEHAKLMTKISKFDSHEIYRNYFCRDPSRQFFLWIATTSNKILKIKVIGNWEFKCCEFRGRSRKTGVVIHAICLSPQ